MSSLVKPSTFLVFFSRRAHWNKDYKPGPFPRTLEERIAAAKKYNLHPMEYQFYPDDGTGLGDYPKLPDIGIEERDPFYPWDNPELKRNFNEPLHAEYGLIREDRFALGKKLRYPLWMQWVQFLGTLLGWAGITWLFDQITMFHPMVPRQYPQEGKTHYTFDAPGGDTK